MSITINTFKRIRKLNLIRKTMTSLNVSIKCDVCNQIFPSKSKLFKHLEDHGFDNPNAKAERIAIVFGWLSQTILENNVWVKDSDINSIENEWHSEANRIERHVFNAISTVDNGYPTILNERPKGYSRSSTCSQKTVHMIGMEPSNHALTDIICYNSKKRIKNIDDWIYKVNVELEQYHIRVLDRITLPKAAYDFNAEVNCTQRRYEICIPLDMIMPQDITLQPTEPIIRTWQKRAQLMEDAKNDPKVNSVISDMDRDFPADTIEGQRRIAYFRQLKVLLKQLAGKYSCHNFMTGNGGTPDDAPSARRIDRFYHKEIIILNGQCWAIFSISGDLFLKGQVARLMGLVIGIMRGWLPYSYLQDVFCTDYVADVPSIPGYFIYLAECRFAYYEATYSLEYRLDPRRRRTKKVTTNICTNIPPSHDNGINILPDTNNTTTTTTTTTNSSNNNSSSDNINKCTINHINEDDNNMNAKTSIDNNIVNDKDSNYSNDMRMTALTEWKSQIHQHIAALYTQQESIQTNPWINQFQIHCQEICDKHHKMMALKSRSIDILEKELLILIEKESHMVINNDSIHLDDNMMSSLSLHPSLSPSTTNTTSTTTLNTATHDFTVSTTITNNTTTNSINNDTITVTPTVSNTIPPPTGSNPFYTITPVEQYSTLHAPKAYQRVLYLLRQADSSGNWPLSTTMRQKVMENTTLIEHGGRGGSFSVGRFPPHLPIPKGNKLFPELMEACFELERIVCPYRVPSTTIAINRHAQFLPHRDSGAGSGQTTSLIVGLGDYSGGELMLDTTPYNIRYHPIEFDGWGTRHWTLPFIGERYSLVWFTPLGVDINSPLYDN